MLVLFYIRKPRPLGMLRGAGSKGHDSSSSRSNGVLDDWSIDNHRSGCPPRTVHGKPCWYELPCFQNPSFNSSPSLHHSRPPSRLIQTKPRPVGVDFLLSHSLIGRKTLALRRRLDYAQRGVKTAACWTRPLALRAYASERISNFEVLTS
jgi:hypothetical protein